MDQRLAILGGCCYVSVNGLCNVCYPPRLRSHRQIGVLRQHFAVEPFMATCAGVRIRWGSILPTVTRLTSSSRQTGFQAHASAPARSKPVCLVRMHRSHEPQHDTRCGSGCQREKAIATRRGLIAVCRRCSSPVRRTCLTTVCPDVCTFLPLDRGIRRQGGFCAYSRQYRPLVAYFAHERQRRR